MRRSNPGNWLFKIVPIFIGLVFIIIIGWYVVLGYFASKGLSEISEHGLKSVLERIWEGPKKSENSK